jgi:hypothetical protein
MSWRAANADSPEASSSSVAAWLRSAQECQKRPTAVSKETYYSVEASSSSVAAWLRSAEGSKET